MKNDQPNLSESNELIDQSLTKLPPKKWKMMLLVWVTIYPLLNIFFPLLSPYISDFSLPIRLFIMTVVIVPIMSFILGGLQKKFFAWLRK